MCTGLRFDIAYRCTVHILLFVLHNAFRPLDLIAQYCYIRKKLLQFTNYFKQNSQFITSTLLLLVACAIYQHKVLSSRKRLINVRSLANHQRIYCVGMDDSSDVIRRNLSFLTPPSYFISSKIKYQTVALGMCKTLELSE